MFKLRIAGDTLEQKNGGCTPAAFGSGSKEAISGGCQSPKKTGFKEANRLTYGREGEAGGGETEGPKCLRKGQKNNKNLREHTMPWSRKIAAPGKGKHLPFKNSGRQRWGHHQSTRKVNEVKAVFLEKRNPENVSRSRTRKHHAEKEQDKSILKPLKTQGTPKNTKKPNANGKQGCTQKRGAGTQRGEGGNAGTPKFSSKGLNGTKNARNHYRKYPGDHKGGRGKPPKKRRKTKKQKHPLTEKGKFDPGGNECQPN